MSHKSIVLKNVSTILTFYKYCSLNLVHFNRIRRLEIILTVGRRGCKCQFHVDYSFEFTIWVSPGIKKNTFFLLMLL